MDAEDASKETDGEKLAGQRMRVSMARPRNFGGPRNRFVTDRYSRGGRDDRSPDRRDRRY